jgi:hypothetical protein
MTDKLRDQHEILEAILQAAAGEYAIVHFERRGDTFRVWPPDNAAPFSVAVVLADARATGA